jgi:hypothetical protein
MVKIRQLIPGTAKTSKIHERLKNPDPAEMKSNRNCVAALPVVLYWNCGSSLNFSNPVL